MAAQGRLQGVQQMQALLAQGGQVAANAAKGAGSGLAAKGAGDFLLHLDHAHIAFGLIVVKGDHQAMQEGQHGLLVGEQAIQQVAGRTLFDAAFVSRGSLRVRFKKRSIRANRGRTCEAE